jgi:hypothetical protein
MSREPLGTVIEAAEALGTDIAEVWEMVAAGLLVATRENDAGPWTIWPADAATTRDRR